MWYCTYMNDSPVTGNKTHSMHNSACPLEKNLTE